ncbi:hypothetical protein [Paraburkholderia sp. BCC1884]|uniref:hypothetical protein n=1 Tax=Paraburkholderia sp. BCC1884 TaxID=2562668 RepID=UPI001183C957|nr:hypothetical protein [Paraburkholderia sp. BCC1884]
MKAPKKFKRWYSVSEAATTLSQLFEEPISQDDVLEQIFSGEMPAWWDVSGRYAVAMYPVCHYFSDPTQNPLYDYFPEASEERLQWLRAGTLDYNSEDSIEVLHGLHRIAVLDRSDLIVAPIGEHEAKTEYVHGVLVFDEDGESVLRIVRRKSPSDSFSYKSKDYVNITSGEFPDHSEFRIAASDIHAALNEIPVHAEGDSPQKLTDAERDKLLKQIAALALVLAEKGGKYTRGGKPNVSQIAAAIGEVIEALPDADRNGLKSSSVRDSISAGLTLLAS